MFSLLLSFIIDLYNFIPLTPNANIDGINKIFCNNKDVMAKHIPFPVPNVAKTEAIVYPIQKPLNIIIPYTKNIPITVELTNHNIIASFTFSIIDVFSNFVLSI